MAGVKFSAFTTGATTANTLIVGYDSVAGTNNQYTLAQLKTGLAIPTLYDGDGTIGAARTATLTDYLIFSGGTIYIDRAGATDTFTQMRRATSMKISDKLVSGGGARSMRDSGGSDFYSMSQNGLLLDRNASIGHFATPTEALDIVGNAKIAGQSYSPIHTITYADPPVIDWNDGSIQTVTLTGSPATAIAAPSNPKDGATYILIVKQDATGSRTFAGGWNAVFKWKGGTAPTLSTGGNAVDIITFVCDGANYYGVDSLNFS